MLALSVLGIWASRGGLKNQRVLALGILYGTLFFVLTGAFLFFYQRLRALPKTSPFSVAIPVRLHQDERTLGGPFCLDYRSRFGATLSPIHQMIFIRLTNLQPVRSMIETYRVETQNARGEWFKLIRMDGQIGSVYMISDDLKKATLIKSEALDTVLINRSIAPNETVEGTAYFELPENAGPNAPLRIYVKDFGGAEVVQTIRHSQMADFAQGAVLYPVATVDLSNSRLMYYSEAMR